VTLRLHRPLWFVAIYALSLVAVCLDHLLDSQSSSNWHFDPSQTDSRGEGMDQCVEPRSNGLGRSTMLPTPEQSIGLNGVSHHTHISSTERIMHDDRHYQSSSHHLEHRPRPFRRRIPGEAHDDFQRQRAVHRGQQGSCPSTKRNVAGFEHQLRRSMSHRSTPATRSETHTSRAPTFSTRKAFQRSRCDRPGFRAFKIEACSLSGQLTMRGVTRDVDFAVDGPTSAGEGPLGEHPHRVVRDCTDQPERLRSDMERSA
jgi:hypothetical protein